MGSCKLQPFDAEALCTYIQSSAQFILCTPFRCHLSFTENYTDMCSVKINLNGVGRATTHFAKPTCKQEQTTLPEKTRRTGAPSIQIPLLPLLLMRIPERKVWENETRADRRFAGGPPPPLYSSPVPFSPSTLSTLPRCRFEFGSTRLRNAICKQDGGVGIVGGTVSCFFSTGWKSVSKNEQQQKRERNICPQTGQASSFCLA